jgi:hypothetical protein
MSSDAKDQLRIEREGTGRYRVYRGEFRIGEVFGGHGTWLGFNAADQQVCRARTLRGAAQGVAEREGASP